MRLLLVDDEEYSRKGILAVVNWKELGITEIRTAENGSDGLQTASSFRPDIILADVRMPKMDGLTMCHKIREFLPTTSFILISGYSDKEYLKSAIRLSAVNYLEKPFLPKELIESLKQAIQKHRTLANGTADKREASSLPENPMVTALLRRHTSSASLWGQLQESFPSFTDGSCFLTALLSMGEPADIEPLSASFQETLFALIRRHFPKTASGNVLLGSKHENMVIMHLSFEQDADLHIRLGSLCQDLHEFLKDKCSYNIIIGHAVANPQQLYQSYEAAMIGVQQCFFHGPDCVFDCSLQPFSHQSAVFSFSQEHIDDFIQQLKNQGANEACTYIHQLCKELKNYDYTLISTVKDFFSQLVRKLHYYYDTFTLSSEGVTELLADSINHIWNCRYLEEVEHYLCNRINSLSEQSIHHTAQLTDNPLSHKIKSYIDANYCDTDLCLQSLSDHFNITTSYICIIFKKYYQKTVNQYINEKRIEKSIDYLEHSNKKVKEISALIGYPDSNYFIKVFKKVTGITPKEYRRK